MNSRINGKSLLWNGTLLTTLLVGNGGGVYGQAQGQTAAASSAAQPVSASAEKLVIEDVIVGTGEEIQLGTWPAIQYKIIRLDGEVIFDTRMSPTGEPFQFFFSEVLMEGWVQGLQGMKSGGVRRVTTPPAYAFRNSPPEFLNITPDETVIFEFESLSLQKLPQVKMGKEVVLRRLREGQGPSVKYGDWITFHLRVFAGENMRTGLNTENIETGALQIALPSPNGIFTGSSRSMRFNIPLLDTIVYGMKAGERRDASFASSRIFGNPIGEPRIGIRSNESFVLEIDCLKITGGADFNLDNGLRIQELVIGDGRFAHMMTSVQYRYRGILPDGTVIESNWDDDEPSTIRLYSSHVIPGVRLGLQGMRVGGERRLFIPASLAFGGAPREPYDNVPPNAEVVYDIKLVDVEDTR